MRKKKWVIKLDPEEQEILRAWENGEYVSVSNLEASLAEARAAATRHMAKLEEEDPGITRRIDRRVKAWIKEMKKQDGPHYA